MPDISFTAVELSTQSQPVYHFVCTTDLQFYGCTVEFLLNGRTSDDMRFADNTCYNKDGQCSPHACSCSGTCKQFEWNLTSISNLDYITFGCFARIEEDQLVFKANISLMQNLGGRFMFIIYIHFTKLHQNYSVSILTTIVPTYRCFFVLHFCKHWTFKITIKTVH